MWCQCYPIQTMDILAPRLVLLFWHQYGVQNFGTCWCWIRYRGLTPFLVPKWHQYYSAGQKFRTFYVMTFLWPPCGRGLTLNMVEYENINSWTVGFYLDVELHYKLSSTKLPISSRVARKKSHSNVRNFWTRLYSVCRAFQLFHGIISVVPIQGGYFPAASTRRRTDVVFMLVGHVEITWWNMLKEVLKWWKLDISTCFTT